MPEPTKFVIIIDDNEELTFDNEEEAVLNYRHFIDTYNEWWGHLSLELLKVTDDGMYVLYVSYYPNYEGDYSIVGE